MTKANGDGREGREVLPDVAEHPAVALLRVHALLYMPIEARRHEAHEEVCALAVTALGGSTAPFEGRVHPLAPWGVSHHGASFSQSDGKTATPVMTRGAARTGAGRSGTCTAAALSRTLFLLRSNACLMRVFSAPCWASTSFPFLGHEYPRLPLRKSKRRVRIEGLEVGGKDR